MKRIVMAVLLICFNCGALSAQTPTGWKLLKQVDKFTDEEHLTLVLPSTDKVASLRVHCNEKGTYVVLLIVPKIRTADPMLLQTRFDKKAPSGYLMMRIDSAEMVSTMGGATTGSVFAFASNDMSKAVKAITAEDVETTANGLLDGFGLSRQFVYQVVLAPVGSIGTEGTFNVAGFSQAVKALSAHCPLP